MKNTKLVAFAFAVTMAAAPAFAQGPSGTVGKTSSDNSSSMNAPGNVGAGGAGMTSGGASMRVDANHPSETNPVLTDAGNVRASKVIGSSVYNDKNEKIGAIDDIILGKDDKPAQVVISVGGFLGIGSKLVAVPYDKLQFGNTRENSDNRVVMPGATKQTVGALSDYHYTKNS
jgi:sporulation protein YlmC with PRC-barrel domain